MKKILTASITLAVLMSGPATVATAPASPAHKAFPKRPGNCAKRYTVAMATRAARATYAGSKDVTRAQLRHLAKYLRCQRYLPARKFVREYYARQRKLWHDRRYPPVPATPYSALASWYYDAGSTACGFHARYGVANKTLPCGTQVTIAYGRREVSATVDDRGPYVGGRVWDLSQTTAGALDFSGVDTVRTSVSGGY